MFGWRCDRDNRHVRSHVSAAQVRAMFKVMLLTVGGAVVGVVTVWFVSGFAPPDSGLDQIWPRAVGSLVIGCLPGAILGAIVGAADAVVTEVRALRKEIAEATAAQQKNAEAIRRGV
jgi:hypothetical protein